MTRTVVTKKRLARQKSVVPFFSFFESTKKCHLWSKNFAPMSTAASKQKGREFDQVEGLYSLCPPLEGGDAP